VVVDEKPVELALEHVLVHPRSQMVGLSMRQVRLRSNTGALVVGLQRPGESLLFNPKGAEVFEAGDVILAMGTHEALKNLHQLARGDMDLTPG